MHLNPTSARSAWALEIRRTIGHDDHANDGDDSQERQMLFVKATGHAKVRFEHACLEICARCYFYVSCHLDSECSHW